MRLAKIQNGIIIYSDNIKQIVIGQRRIFNPSQSQLRQYGFNDLPTIQHTDSQQVYYVIQDNQIVAKKRDIPKRVIKYSKLKIIQNVQKQGIDWSVAQQFMKTNNLYNKWIVAQELSNDYEGFDTIIQNIKQQFPNVDVDKILLQSQIN